MLDIKYIVANPEEVKKRLSLRKPELAAQIDDVLARYDQYKTVLARVEELRAKRNEMSKSIGKIKQEQGDEAAKEAMAAVGKLKEEMAAKEAELCLWVGFLKLTHEVRCVEVAAGFTGYEVVFHTFSKSAARVLRKS